jgi:hypothetical protein
MFKVGLYIFIKIQIDVTSKLNIESIIFLNQWHPKYTCGLLKFSY